MQVIIPSLLATPPPSHAGEAATKEQREEEQRRAQMRHQQNWWKRVVYQARAPDGQTAQLKDALLQASRFEQESSRREQEALSQLAKLQEQLVSERESANKQVDELKAKLKSQVVGVSTSLRNALEEKAVDALRTKCEEMDQEMRDFNARLDYFARSKVGKDDQAQENVLLQAQNEALLLQLEGPQLQSVVVEKEQTIARMTTQLEEQQVAANTALSNASREKSKAEKLEERVANLQREREADIAEAVALQAKKTNKALDELARAQEQLQQYRHDDDRHIEQDHELRAMRASLEKAAARYSNLKGQYDELKAERKRATLAAEEALKANSTNDKAELDAALAQLAAMKTERDIALERTIALERREAELTSGKVEIDDVLEQLASMRTERDIALDRMSAFSQREAKVLAECDLLKRENDSLRNEKKDVRIEDFENRLAAADQDLAKMSESLKEAEGYRQLHDDLDLERETLKKEVDHLRYQMEELQNLQCVEEVEELRLLTARQEEELSRSNRQAVETSAVLAQSLSERDALKADLENLAGDRADEVEQLRLLTKTQEEDLTRASRQALETSASLAQILSERDALKAELENSVDEGKVVLQQANERTSAAEARAAAFLAENQRLQQELADARVHEQQLAGSSQNVQVRAAPFLAENQQLQQEFVDGRVSDPERAGMSPTVQVRGTAFIQTVQHEFVDVREQEVRHPQARIPHVAQAAVGNSSRFALGRTISSDRQAATPVPIRVAASGGNLVPPLASQPPPHTRYARLPAPATQSSIGESVVLGSSHTRLAYSRINR